jgi:hypothetical protein
MDKMLKQYNPKNVYFSKSLYLNARNIETTTWKKRILKTDLVFDLDNVSPEEPLKVIRLMNPLKPIYILQTSKNNYQINYGFEKISEELYNKIKKECDIDSIITEDNYRVIRAIGSYNGNKSFQTRIINEQDIVQRLESLKSNDRDDISTMNKCAEVGCQTNPPAYYKSKYISNKCGKGKYIFFAKLKTIKPNKIKKFQDIYKMNLYIIDYGNYYGLLSNKILSKRRLNKCLRFFKKEMKFNQIFIRTTGYKYPNKIINKPIKEMKLVKDYNYPESKYHNHFLNYLGFGEFNSMKEPKILETSFKVTNG